MSLARKADVVVVARARDPIMDRCLTSVLRHSGSSLNRLVLVDLWDGAGEQAEALDRIADRNLRVTILRVPGTREVEASNLGIEQCDGDLVLLSSHLEVMPGWLDELGEVAHLEPRTALAAPLVDLGGTDSILPNDSDRLPDLDASTFRAACADLPRWSAAPVADAPCAFLRGDVLRAVGPLDPSYASLEHAIVDWSMRAQSLGFVAKRANHVFAQLIASNEERPGPWALGPSEAVLRRRHPQLPAQLDRFEATVDRALGGHAIRLKATGKLRVAYDLRPLPREQVGTRTYAMSLVKALAAIAEVELTLLVRDPSQAKGLEGRVVTPETWRDDVAVIHRPMQIIDPRELSLLYQSSAHLVLTYQDLIGYRIPLVFPNDAEHQSYRATSCLSLQGIQRILAYSESAAAEIVEEFGVSREDVTVVSLGVDADWFASQGPRDAAIQGTLRLPRRYFFSIATDFPHKNLPCLLDAYAAFRARWADGSPPNLVLAGYSTNARNGFYQHLASGSRTDGVIFLGPVSQERLRVLYQRSLALIFPSLYEGFGLPPLEAMAAGVPVIAMPISSIPEVGGDCALYPADLSPGALARAMERLAGDESLRASLRARGVERVRRFSWERTARETLEAYRSVVLRPSARSLAMRRRLRESILCWSASVVSRPSPALGAGSQPVIGVEPLGIRNAWKALHGAIHTRLRREAMRLHARSGQRAGSTLKV
jgi:glycosyltransferase involved in cell wall biosynthesis